MARSILLLALILTIAIGAIPGYLSGQWLWSDIPIIPPAIINSLRGLRQTGLPLPGWQMLDQAAVEIGGNSWSVQVIEKAGQEPVTLFLMPPEYYRSQPQVEWTDLNSVQRWKVADYQTLTFPAGGTRSGQITASFFRAWRNQTFAVVQWYAWPGGGHFAPARWFWLDQSAQLRRQRVPWIAVCLAIPMPPLEELKAAQPQAKSLAETVQATLEEEIFSRQPTK